VDAPPILEFAKHVLDFVALFIDPLLWGIWIFLLDFEGIQASI
jgi:hypothetical protein